VTLPQRTDPPIEPQPVFYYDLGSPLCYLVAERIMTALPAAPEWEPVLGSLFDTDTTESDRRLIERLAAEFSLQPVRWPQRWPPDTHFAALAATYAKRVGRAVAFSLAAFRQAFAGGRDLGDRDTILIAAAACEVHPNALIRGVALKSVSEALDAASARASALGVSELPAIEAGGRVFQGRHALEQAVEAFRDAA
jgi:2-hydroxychromene-2-carboxylate isomerase